VSATTASSDHTRPLLPPDYQCPQSSTALRFRPPRFFVSPTVHAFTAMCAARLLLPTQRPVSFSPPRCTILFPSPSHLCIARSSPATPLLFVRDVKDHTSKIESVPHNMIYKCVKLQKFWMSGDICLKGLNRAIPTQFQT
jgi:hypothetical protein